MSQSRNSTEAVAEHPLPQAASSAPTRPRSWAGEISVGALGGIFAECLEMARVVSYDEREWVDAVVEYPLLPACVQTNADKWDRRLKALGIAYTLPDCRSTRKGDITQIEEGRTRKSVYVVKTLWDSAVARKTAVSTALSELAQTEGRNSPQVICDGGATSGSRNHSAQMQEVCATAIEEASSSPAIMSVIESESDQTPTHMTMTPIDVVDKEKFVHDGQRIHIRIYGERTAHGLFLNAGDVALGIKMREDNMPKGIELVKAKVHGNDIQVLPWYAFLHLAFLKSHKYPVAREISQWVSDTMFSVQYDGGVGALPQAAFASRRHAFRPDTYIEDTDHKIIYAIDFCAAADLEQAMPGTVALLVPQDRIIHDFRCVKIGCGTKQRLSNVRCDLRKILPSSDPRPIMCERIPHVCSLQLKDEFEEPLHTEFADQRIGHEGRPGLKLRNENYTEIFVLDADMKETLIRKATRIAHKHNTSLLEKAELDASQARQKLAELTEMQIELRIKDTSIQHMTATIDRLENTVRKADAENEHLKLSISKLLPKRMANVFRGVFASS